MTNPNSPTPTVAPRANAAGTWIVGVDAGLAILRHPTQRPGDMRGANLYALDADQTALPRRRREHNVPCRRASA
jgi:hypothetical protein